MKSFPLALLVFLLLSSAGCMAQKHTVNGRIIAFKKYPVNKVRVSAKKAKTEVFSDSLGIFSITTNKKDVIVFDAQGFQNLRVKLKGEDHLNVNLILIEQEASYKDLVKANHLSKETLEYGIENLLDDNNNFDQLGNIYEIIQYVYPQAKITDVGSNQTSSDNSFGTTGRQVILESRGVNSINASPYALLVVDGIVFNDISGITPQDVKKVNILLGNQAADYGLGGANGVVEIWLKY